jgi:hypothetical protein
MKVDADKISDSLGLDPIQLDQEAKPVTEYKPKKLDDTTEDDFDFARGNLLNIILKGGEAVDEMLEFARQSQHPRSYEVLSTLLKTLTDANKDLLSLSKTRKELTKTDDQPQTVNQNLFVGSTAELQKLLKGADEKS